MQAFPSRDCANYLNVLNLDVDSPPVLLSLGLRWDLKNDTLIITRSEKLFTQRGVLSTINSLFGPLGFVAPINIQGKFLLWQLTRIWNIFKLLEFTPKPLSCLLNARTHFLRCLHKTHRSRSLPEAGWCRREVPCWFHHGESQTGTINGPYGSQAWVGNCCLGSGNSWSGCEWTGRYPWLLEVVYRQKSGAGVYLQWNQKASLKEELWKYIHTSQNSADVATRSVLAGHLLGTNWLTGPAFLAHSEDTDLSVDTLYSLVDPDSDAEVCCHTTKVSNCHGGLGSHPFERFSMWCTLIRALANLIHVALTFKSSKEKNLKGCNGWHLCSRSCTTETLQQAKPVILRCVQREGTFENRWEAQACTSGFGIEVFNRFSCMQPCCHPNYQVLSRKG